MDAWMNGWMDRDGSMDGVTDDGWMHGCMDGSMEMDRWMGARMDG